MPRSKTKKSEKNSAAYFVTDREERADGKKGPEVQVFDDDDIHECLDYLRGKCSENGRCYRTSDGVLLAARRVVGSGKFVPWRGSNRR